MQVPTDRTARQVISHLSAEIRRGLASVLDSRAARHSLIAGLIQFVSQALRFAANIVLASLLTPAIFGVLAIVTTVRTGIELLSDLGINQSIVVSEEGDEKAFIETAWAIQAMRGVVLTAIGLAIAYPVALFYEIEDLAILLAVGSAGSFIGGFARPGPAILQRRRMINRLLVQRLSVAVATFVFSTTFALISPTALSIVFGNVAAVAFGVLLSFLILPLPGYRPRIVAKYRSEIVSFGKWIFLSSAIYYFATNFDRLYLPAHIPLAIFGIYGIARSLSDVVVQTAHQVSQLVLLPAVARSKDSLRSNHRFRVLRFWGLATTSAGLGGLIAIADLLVVTVFDSRYWLAAAILPILLFGSWFTLIGLVVESTLLGLSKPIAMASGNAMRLVTSVAGIPLALGFGGLLPAIIAIAVSDLPRTLVLNWHAHREKVAFFRQEAMLALILIATAVLARMALAAIGLVDGFVSTVQWNGLAELLEFSSIV